jgi:hypothetical protein
MGVLVIGILSQVTPSHFRTPIVEDGNMCFIYYVEKIIFVEIDSIYLVFVQGIFNFNKIKKHKFVKN